MAPHSDATRPSSWWILVAVIAAAFSLTAVIAATVHQRNANRPIGEGQLLFEDAQLGVARIEDRIAGGASPEEAVRHLRNSLGIEGVALVDEQGVATAATSDPLVGTKVTNPVLEFALGEGRFGAVATPIGLDLEVDGVTEWHEGDVLYTAILPGAESDRSLLLFYDISQLLGRRTRAGGIQTQTVELAVLAVFFAMASFIALIGRFRSIRRYREIDREAEFLRKESEALQSHNAELEVARSKAEKALALAEETNRVRSEFVLMINHELRTPLTSVVTGAELLRLGDSLGPDEDQIVESLVHDGRRLQAMIDQLLALARVENRGLAFTPQQIPFADLCRAATSSHPQVLPHQSKDPHHADSDSVVVTDPQTLTQLVASLVDNAFTHGATSVEVTCAHEPRSEPQLVVGDPPDPAAFISVIDNGPGIRKEFLPRAFEKFEKDSRSSGTGLGLYMARLMADAIGASLLVWTSAQGATISIALPLVDVKSKVGAA